MKLFKERHDMAAAGVGVLIGFVAIIFTLWFLLYLCSLMAGLMPGIDDEKDETSKKQNMQKKKQGQQAGQTIINHARSVSDDISKQSNRANN